MNGTGLHCLHHGLHDGLKTEHFSVVEGKNSKIVNRILIVNLSGSKEDTGAGHPQQHLQLPDRGHCQVNREDIDIDS